MKKHYFINLKRTALLLLFCLAFISNRGMAQSYVTSNPSAAVFTADINYANNSIEFTFPCIERTKSPHIFPTCAVITSARLEYVEGASSDGTENWIGLFSWKLSPASLSQSFNCIATNSYSTLNWYQKIGTTFSKVSNNLNFSFTPPSTVGEKTDITVRWDYINHISYLNDENLRFRVVCEVKNYVFIMSWDQAGSASNFTWYLGHPSTTKKDLPVVLKGDPQSTPVITGHTINADGTISVDFKVDNYNPYNDQGVSHTGVYYLSTDYTKTQFPNHAYGPAQFVDKPLAGTGIGTRTGTFVLDKSTSKNIEILNNGDKFYPSTWRNDIYIPHTYKAQYGDGHAGLYKKGSAYTIIPYPSPNKITVTTTNNGQLKLDWTINAGTAQSEKDPFNLQYSKDGGKSWVDLPDEPYSHTKNTYSKIIYYPDVDKGNITYKFRVKRSKFNWGVGTAVTTTSSLSTNSLTIKSVTATVTDTGNVLVKWENNLGVTGDNWYFQVTAKATGEGDRIVGSQYLRFADNPTSVTDLNPSPCTPTHYEVAIFKRDDGSTTDGTKYFSKSTTEAITVSRAPEGRFEKFSVAKGFYNDRVIISWTMSENANFQRYSVARKIRNNPNASEQELVQIGRAGSSYTYEDKDPIPGVYYDYTVYGWVECDGNLMRSISETSIGFSQPYGVVSGRIAYEGSSPVEGVTVIAESENTFTNKSIFLSADQRTGVITPYVKNTLSPTEFTLQCWIKTLSDGVQAYTSFFNSWGKYYVESNNGKLSFRFWLKNEDQTPVALNHFFPINIPYDEYVHITISHSIQDGIATSKLYLYAKDTILTAENTSSVENYLIEFPEKENISGYKAHVDQIYLGDMMIAHRSTNRYMDEFRLWKRALSAEEIAQNFDRYITGKEEGLALYYRFDETEGMEVFDVSCQNNVYNENHGKVLGANNSLRSETEVPTPNQLAIKATTNKNGHYLINTIPYTGSGSTFTITPIMGVHVFNPSNKPLFFGPGNSTQNNVDFTDISSFDVEGFVYYDGGTYPVKGCGFEIDGKTVVNADGTPNVSDEDGKFTISVPIGKHKVRVVKTGHTFVDDGFLLDGNSDLVYNTHLNNIKFRDITRVKLIGHIVGGKIEHEKPSGFGDRVNNIGADELKLVAAKGNYKLRTTPLDTLFVHYNGKWKKPDSRISDTTRMSVDGNTVTIHVSPETGEFVAYLYPEVYNILPIKPEGYDELTRTEELDLSGTPVMDSTYLSSSIRTWMDSVLIPAKGNQLAYYEKTEKGDTIYFNHEWGFYLQAAPSFTVKQLVNNKIVDYFGEKMVIVEAPLTGTKDTITFVLKESNPVEYNFDLPVFQQGKKYSFFMKAFEQYVNHVNNTTDIAPVAGGNVQNNNSIALVTNSTLELDDDGEGIYTFTAGVPDLTTGIKQTESVVNIDDRLYYGTHNGDNYMQAYLLGAKSTGTDFMTAGPDEIDAIVFDPPGSESYAYLEKGTTITKVRENLRNDALETKLGAEVDLGTKVTTFVGIGAGVITEAEVIAEIDVDFETVNDFTEGDKTTTSTTLRERISTSADPMYVGSLGDIYIGNSTNILYGLVNSVSALKATSTVEEDRLKTSKDKKHAIAISQGLAFGPTFNTRFIYTEHQIENIMIPKWKLALKNLFTTIDPNDIDTNIIKNPVYISKLRPDEPGYGKRNTDSFFGSEASKAEDYDNGKSYRVIYPANYFKDRREFTDSVVYYNQQIDQWTKQLAASEEAKVKMKDKKNYSFGGGSTVEYSKYNSMSVEKIDNTSFVISPSLGFKKGVEICGIEMCVTGSAKYTYGTTTNKSDLNDTTALTGFVLSESGPDDQITVDYGTSSYGTFAFRTRGGRTSCPYEGDRKTKYYQPGKHTLNEATMQIEVPVISVKGNTTAIQVPANRPGVFTLELKNESETGSDGWFTILIDDSTNLYGAEVRIDGAVIGNGRNILVRSGEVQEKTLTIHKGPNEDRYENIKILLVSQCQYAPTDPQEDIISSVSVSVDFIPTCTDVVLKAPANNWVVNTSTGDSITVIVDGYDVNYANFSYIVLEYKATSASSWNTLMKFYANKQLQEADPSSLTYLMKPTDNNIRYVWKMGSIPDGTYELRAYSVCGPAGNPIEGSISTISAGIKDMTRPMSLGYPSPANGILNPGDELSILFNENIQTGLISRYNFLITGVLNEREIVNPTVGLSFEGNNSAETELPIYTDGSFAIEGWFKRDAGKGGTLFTYGSGSDYISAGFNNTGEVFVTIGNETKNATGKLAAAAGEWEYFSISYDRTKNAVTAYLFKSE
ncbi:LamG domain-containing protein, partial [Bacteroidales bacterium OttesenSCG-928-B11]|nr:LamG domain-containing protein [Bacteroidales bacterium OttesenSCG-928-B11]